MIEGRRGFHVRGHVTFAGLHGDVFEALKQQQSEQSDGRGPKRDSYPSGTPHFRGFRCCPPILALLGHRGDLSHPSLGYDASEAGREPLVCDPL
jgi:hypothetical protein